MGAQGIKRRKHHRAARDGNTPPEPKISDGDVGRLFGRFTWGAYTPAGWLERNGFFLRQLSRNGSDHALRKSLRLLYLSLPAIAAVLGAVVLVIYLLGRVWSRLVDASQGVSRPTVGPSNPSRGRSWRRSRCRRPSRRQSAYPEYCCRCAAST
jgi:hypothetical protein